MACIGEFTSGSSKLHAAGLDSPEFASPDGGVKPPLQRKQITVPRHSVFLAAKALFLRFGAI
jgi:hypothetical protein